jgi:acyl transferase domain-containing protein
MIAPQPTVMMSKVGFMAPDGRCKTFEATADGFGRGEGSGVLVLKRLSDALAAGDRVLAVIRGSAVNQDGRSTLLTAPNGPAQEAMIREALAAARLQPEHIGFVETHGTGTALGDPIEVEAIAATIGRPAPGSAPCWLGGVKANLGHLEAAAGIAGVIKAVLALRHAAIPPQPRFQAPSPHIRLDGTRLAIPTRLTPWEPTEGRPRRAAVSAFGVGGTNAHVILEQAPALPLPDAGAEGAAWLLPLSAKSPAALTTLARRWVAHLAATEAPVADLCHSAARRTLHDHRLAVVGRTRQELHDSLSLWLAEAPSPVAGVALGPLPRRIAFVFSGQGPQWFAMGRQLLDQEPVFADTIRAVDAALLPLAGWSVQAELARDAEASRLDQTEFAQPCLFALQVALAALLRAWGVVPDAVIGHSVGEIAALHVAGVLDLAEATRIVWHRGRIMQGATGQGGMASVALSQPAARDRIARFGARLSIAAVNAPNSVVVSGETDALDAALADLPAHVLLPVHYAFHSAQMEPLRAELLSALGEVAAKPPSIPVYSTVTGARADHLVFDAAYFGRNMRDTVCFAGALAALSEASAPHRLAIVEIAPHPVLAQSIAACLDGTDPLIIAAQRRGRPERETMLRAAATLFEAGCLAAPARAQPGRGRVVSLPPYPWQRQRHWLPKKPLHAPRAAPEPAGGHRLAGTGTRIAGTGLIVHTTGPGQARDWLAQHRVLGRALVPGAALMEAFLAVATAALGAPASLADFILHRPLELSPVDSAPTPWQIVARPAAGAADAAIDLAWFEADPDAANESDAAPWRSVASATASRASPGPAPAPLGWAGRETGPDPASVYERFAALGVEFGPAFRLLSDIVLAPGRARAGILPPPGLDAAGHLLHPVLLDAAVQLCSLLAAPDGSGNLPGDIFLPVAAARIEARPPAGAPGQHMRAEASCIEAAADSIVADVTIRQADGAVVASLTRLRLLRADAASLGRLKLHDIAWERIAPAQPAAAAPPFLLLADAGGVADSLVADLPGKVLRVLAGQGFARLEDTLWRIDPADPDQFRRVLAEAGWSGGTLVHCWSLDTPPGEPMRAADDANGLGALLHLVQAAQSAAHPGRLVVVTRGAQIVTAQEPLAGLHPRAAALWGLADSIRTEEPALRTRTIDLDPAESGSAGLLAELLDGSGPPAIALRGGTRFRPHLRAMSPASGSRAPDEAARELVLVQPGTFEGLGWQPARVTPPGPGQLRLRVHAAGLNFRDVLLTLGLYPGAAVPLGAECAGVVEAAGAGVPFTVGQRAFGRAAASFSASVTVPASDMAPMPDDLAMTDAAALPVAFLTALYGLHRLARLRAGETVLIHAAAGGVGLAAVQIAQRAGARVFATAGSPGKRALLTAMGVNHVMDSRSLDFAGQILDATGGRGVDVLLNSLAGDFIPAGLRALAPGGRFLELGKRGIWTASEIAAARPDIGYFPYDLDAEAAADPTLTPALLAELLAALADGTLRPLPVTAYPLADAAAAMRAMAQARHVGKLVLRVADDAPRAAPRIRPDATYWITGGLSGLGLETAAWLAARGARHLLLTGRSKPQPAAEARIAALAAQGVRIETRQADAADADAMASVLAGIDPVHPLRGVIHAAGALHDGILANQRWPEAAAAMRGKQAGGWILHRLTRRAKLDFFVLYSAAAVVLGARGQGLYPAANAELDALARYRRALGLPALSVAWGRWGGTGMAARAAAAGADGWAGRGLRDIDPASGFAALERLLAEDAAYGVVAPVDWRRFRATLPPGLDPAFFARLAADPTDASAPAGIAADPAKPSPLDAGAALPEMLALPPASRRAALLAFLRGRTLAVVGLDPATRLDPRKPFREIGLDSLMAVELRNALVRAGGRRLPATLLFDHPSLDALADHLMEEWRLAEPSPSAGIHPITPAAARAIAAMTEDEAEALLMAELDLAGRAA